VLLRNPQFDSVLTRLLPRCSTGAIGAVREFIHSYHRGGSTSGLSQMMLRKLQSSKGSLTCSRCNERF